jgi:hypothetical protein
MRKPERRNCKSSVDIEGGPMIARNNERQEPLAVTEWEIRTMTRELEELHQDVVYPRLLEEVAEWQDAIRSTSQAAPERAATQAGATTRRAFLLGTGAAALGGFLLAACGSSSKSTSATNGRGTSTRTAAAYPASLTGDLKVAALAASLENLGVYAYQTGIQAAQAGKLGKVPPAVVTFAQTAMSQHEQHAQAWNALLQAAGKPAVTEKDPALTPVVQQGFAQVTDTVGLAKLALEVENIAAQTYQVAATVVSSAKAIQTAATIQPVEMQHAAILSFALGQYPVPNAFNPTDKARSASDLG